MRVCFVKAVLGFYHCVLCATVWPQVAGYFDGCGFPKHGEILFGRFLVSTLDSVHFRGWSRPRPVTIWPWRSCSKSYVLQPSSHFALAIVTLTLRMVRISINILITDDVFCLGRAAASCLSAGLGPGLIIKSAGRYPLGLPWLPGPVPAPARCVASCWHKNGTVPSIGKFVSWMILQRWRKANPLMFVICKMIHEKYQTTATLKFRYSLTLA